MLLAGMAGGTSGAASWVEAADIIGRCTCVAMAAGAAAGAGRLPAAEFGRPEARTDAPERRLGGEPGGADPG